MRLMFVDDDRNILNGYRRMLFGQIPSSEVFFFESGLQALDAMQKNHFDIVISDMRMPIMNGVEFLERVRERSPETVRIILSGHSDEELILKSVNAAHQFLAKPCDAEILLGAIRRACTAHTGPLSENLRTTIAGLTTIPSVPTLYLEIVDEMGKGESSLQRIGDIISHDAGMTAKILQMINSAFFGLPRQIGEVHQAVNLLGLTTIKSLVLSAHIFNLLDDATTRSFPIQNLWHHGLYVSRLAQRIAKSTTPDRDIPDYSFVAGLLHDIGKVLLMVNYPTRYRILLDTTQRDGFTVSVTERSLFGSTHAEIGAYLLKLWGLPQPIVDAIEFHHEPMRHGGHSFSAVTAVHAANSLAVEHPVSGDGLNVIDSRLDIEYLNHIGVDSRLDDWRVMTRSLLEEALA